MVTLFSLLERGESGHPAVVVPDGPALTYAQLRAEIADPRSDGFHVRQLRDGARVFVGELFARAHLFGRASKGKRLYVKSEDHVRANAGHDGLNVVIQPASNRGNTDHHGDADDNSQHG